jgi:3,4-dihydroxy 2-butanone 4-phosphate synthase/GTP cyclohydrolase II
LITNNPREYQDLGGFGLRLLGRIRTDAAVTPDNLTYVRTKRDRMGHDVELPVAREAPA